MDGPYVYVSLCASHHFIYACDCLVSAKVFCIADVWVSPKSFFLPPSCPSSRVPSFLFSTMNKTFSWKLTSIFSSSKVEKNYEDGLHLIPSPSSLVKIQNMGWMKFAWDVKAKHCWADFSLSKVCWQHPAMFCLYTSSKLSCPKFEFSLKVKVIGLNLGYLLKSSLFYYVHTYICV